MKKMVYAGEAKALVAERVWKELERALQEPNPEEFFEVLEQCEALPVLFPHLQTESFAALKKVKDLSADPEIRFAVLFYPLAFRDVSFICERYRVPSTYRELAHIVARRHKDFLRIKKLKAEDMLNLFQAADAYRREERFTKLLLVFEGVAQAKNRDSHTAWLREVFEASKLVDVQAIIQKNKSGKDIGELISIRRLELIAKFLRFHREN